LAGDADKGVAYRNLLGRTHVCHGGHAFTPLHTSSFPLPYDCQQMLKAPLMSA
jgi:hypothetical protein